MLRHIIFCLTLVGFSSQSVALIDTPTRHLGAEDFLDGWSSGAVLLTESNDLVFGGEAKAYSSEKTEGMPVNQFQRRTQLSPSLEGRPELSMNTSCLDEGIHINAWKERYQILPSRSGKGYDILLGMNEDWIQAGSLPDCVLSDAEWFEGSLYVLMRPAKANPTASHLYRIGVTPQGGSGQLSLAALCPPAHIAERIAVTEDALYVIARKVGEEARHLFQLRGIETPTPGWTDCGKVILPPHPQWDLAASGSQLLLFSPFLKDVMHCRAPALGQMPDWERSHLEGNSWMEAFTGLDKSLRDNLPSASRYVNQFNLPEKARIRGIQFSLEGKDQPWVRWRIASQQQNEYEGWSAYSEQGYCPIEQTAQFVQYQILHPVQKQPVRLYEVRLLLENKPAMNDEKSVFQAAKQDNSAEDKPLENQGSDPSQTDGETPKEGSMASPIVGKTADASQAGLSDSGKTSEASPSDKTLEEDAANLQHALGQAASESQPEDESDMTAPGEADADRQDGSSPSNRGSEDSLQALAQAASLSGANQSPAALADASSNDSAGESAVPTSAPGRGDSNSAPSASPGENGGAPSDDIAENQPESVPSAEDNADDNPRENGLASANPSASQSDGLGSRSNAPEDRNSASENGSQASDDHALENPEGNPSTAPEESPAMANSDAGDSGKSAANSPDEGSRVEPDSGSAQIAMGSTGKEDSSRGDDGISSRTPKSPSGASAKTAKGNALPNAHRGLAQEGSAAANQRSAKAAGLIAPPLEESLAGGEKTEQEPQVEALAFIKSKWEEDLMLLFLLAFVLLLLYRFMDEITHPVQAPGRIDSLRSLRQVIQGPITQLLEHRYAMLPMAWEKKKTEEVCDENHLASRSLESHAPGTLKLKSLGLSFPHFRKTQVRIQAHDVEPLPLPVASSAAFYRNGSLHVVDRHGAIIASRIREDGTLTPWGVRKGRLPSQSNMKTVAILEDHIVCLSGDSIYAARLLEEGIGEWTKAGVIKGIGQHLTAIAGNGNQLFLAGGSSKGKYIPLVRSVELTPEGLLCNPKTHPSLPAGLREGAFLTDGKRAYWLGGQIGNMKTSMVFSSRIGQDGTLDEWERDTDLPWACCQPSAAFWNENLWAVGPKPMTRNGEACCARMREDGKIRSWVCSQDEVPSPGAGASLAFAEGKFFLFGGRDGNSQPQSEVFRWKPEAAPQA